MSAQNSDFEGDVLDPRAERLLNRSEQLPAEMDLEAAFLGLKIQVTAEGSSTGVYTRAKLDISQLVICYFFITLASN